MCVLIFFEKIVCVLINITVYLKKISLCAFLFGKYSYNDHDETYINGSLYPLITLKLLLA